MTRPPGAAPAVDSPVQAQRPVADQREPFPFPLPLALWLGFDFLIPHELAIEVKVGVHVQVRGRVDGGAPYSK